VLATQNPIETEGTYPLPEAQVDRFMMKVLIGYPTDQEEFLVVQRMTGPLMPVGSVITTHQLLDLQREADKVYADATLMEYAVQLVAATRRPMEFGLNDVARYILYGASPRASINLILTARALAYLRGRTYVLAQDVRDMAYDVMRHRLILSYEALSDGITADMILVRVLDQLLAPAQPLRNMPLPTSARETVQAERLSANSGSTPERILQRLDWQVIRRLDGILQGDYRSLFYGYGLDLADLREYQPGDDIRYMDWNVTRGSTRLTSGSITRIARSRPGSCSI